jgi:hypothetical protein
MWNCRTIPASSTSYDITLPILTWLKQQVGAEVGISLHSEVAHLSGPQDLCTISGSATKRKRWWQLINDVNAGGVFELI